LSRFTTFDLKVSPPFIPTLNDRETLTSLLTTWIDLKGFFQHGIRFPFNSRWLNNNRTAGSDTTIRTSIPWNTSLLNRSFQFNQWSIFAFNKKRCISDHIVHADQFHPISQERCCWQRESLDVVFLMSGDPWIRVHPIVPHGTWKAQTIYRYYCRLVRIGGRSGLPTPWTTFLVLVLKNQILFLMALIFMEIPGNFDRSLWSTVTPQNSELHSRYRCRAPNLIIEAWWEIHHLRKVYYCKPRWK